MEPEIWIGNERVFLEWKTEKRRRKEEERKKRKKNIKKESEKWVKSGGREWLQTKKSTSRPWCLHHHRTHNFFFFGLCFFSNDMFKKKVSWMMVSERNKKQRNRRSEYHWCWDVGALGARGACVTSRASESRSILVVVMTSNWNDVSRSWVLELFVWNFFFLLFTSHWSYVWKSLQIPSVEEQEQTNAGTCKVVVCMLWKTWCWCWCWLRVVVSGVKNNMTYFEKFEKVRVSKQRAN